MAGVPAAGRHAGRERVVRRRVSQGSGRPEPGACVRPALARASDHAAADRVSRAAHQRPGASWNGARVSRGGPAAGHPRPAVAVSGHERPGQRRHARTGRDSQRPVTLK